MPEPTLDWSTAEVKDSKLTVQVDGDLPDGWQDTFNTTVKLLGGGSWGEIKLEEQKAEVSDPAAGDEEKIKHFLESVVQQANATHRSDEDEDEEQGEDGERDEEDEEESEQESDEDKEMADRFQSFAKDDSEEDSDEGDGSEDKDSKGSKGSKDDSDDDSSE
jgi:hypothetical protein